MQQCMDNSNYAGQYSQGLRHGFGAYSFPNGDRYLGQCDSDVPHGYGTYLFASGQAYEGQWAHGKKHGWSVYTVEAGQQWAGPPPCPTFGSGPSESQYWGPGAAPAAWDAAVALSTLRLSCTTDRPWRELSCLDTGHIVAYTWGKTNVFPMQNVAVASSIDQGTAGAVLGCFAIASGAGRSSSFTIACLHALSPCCPMRS